MGGCVSGSPFYRRKTRPRLSMKEILARIEQSDAPVACQFGKARVRYAYVTQRGFYPDDLNKPNQDSFVIARNFAGIPNDCMLSVFDGHGKFGHECSTFVRDNLPLNIAKCFRERRRSKGSTLSVSEVQEACSQAHDMCNNQLRKSTIDDSLSGTTTISVLFHSNNITICNVGDSRAIVAQKITENSLHGNMGVPLHISNMRAVALSRDQTPYRKDERERVKKFGARIMSLDQIEGLEPMHENWGEVNLGIEIDEGGDPPRLWSPHGEYPGTAFTRSIGDSIAEEVGVVAEPEVITRELTSVDKIIVLASDGVFEFLTNQSVIDLCAKFSDPLEACRAVVAEAYELWLQYELRTDDITMTCIFVDSVDGIPEDGDHAQTSDDLSVGVRPARRKTVRRKTIDVQALLANCNASTKNTPDKLFPKTNDEIQRIETAIHSSPLFHRLSDSQKVYMYDHMMPVSVESGDWVIRQGLEGEHFYVIDSGCYEVRILSEGATDHNNTGGNVVYVYDSESSATSRSFGELALLHNTKRNASIIARTTGRLWALPSHVFKRLLFVRSLRYQIAAVLRDVELLKPLHFYLIQKLADSMTEVIDTDDDQEIAVQGQKGDTFYVIVDGECEISCTDTRGKVKQRKTLSKYNHFGEKALFPNHVYEMSLITAQNCKYVKISRSDFESAVGKLQDLIEDHAEHRLQCIPPEDPNCPLVHELQLHGSVHIDNISRTVLCKADKHIYTLKIISKGLVTLEHEEDSVMVEVGLLKMLNKIHFITLCPCIPMLKATYSDPDSLYILFEETIGCTLAQVINNLEISKTEILTKHVATCCIIALEAIHYQGIVYRGINADALFVSHDGCILLSDFRCAKENAKMDNYTLCGAVDYLSPECLAQVGHGQSSDFWALGILLLEFLTGKLPFAAESEIDVYAKIMQFEKGSLTLPNNISEDCCDFLDGLLTPTYENRLGYEGPAVMKRHPWLSNVDWNCMDNACFSNIAKPYLTRALITSDASQNFSEEYSGDQNWCVNF